MDANNPVVWIIGIAIAYVGSILAAIKHGRDTAQTPAMAEAIEDARRHAALSLFDDFHKDSERVAAELRSLAATVHESIQRTEAAIREAVKHTDDHLDLSHKDQLAMHKDNFEQHQKDLDRLYGLFHDQRP